MTYFAGAASELDQQLTPALDGESSEIARRSVPRTQRDANPAWPARTLKPAAAY